MIAILGCGPAGLLTAWAAEQKGVPFHIYSKKVKSDIPGSQHLHGPVPGLTPDYPTGTIQFIRIGTKEDYARKVYDDPARETGWDNYWQVYPSWNLIRVYDKLWEKYHERIDDVDVRSFYMGPLFDLHERVISTIPAQELCHKNHLFAGVPYIIEKLPTPPADYEHEVVVYNGLPGDPWYRWSILGGLCSIEYPFSYSPLETGDRQLISGFKATSTSCTCWPEITRLGRWAEWRHGVTLHSVYERAVKIMEEL